MKRLIFVPAVLIAMGMLALASGQSRMGPHHEMMKMNCPMNVEGAALAVDDAPGGISITFTTRAGEEAIAELRARVEHLGKMHGLTGNEPRMMAGAFIPGYVTFAAVPEGATLTLTPKNPARLVEFREQVREHVEHVRKGNCPMMGMMMRMMEERIEADPVPPPEVEIPCF